MLNRAGRSPLLKHRQNFFSAVRMLIEGVGVDSNFVPFAAAGVIESTALRAAMTHVFVLQLNNVLLGRGFL
ncbi:hypothetical protein IVB14_26025 [Bradyrhizobium sp. 180]|uniref:hypothetical protein n=1 Tax=unclassified Bradyrhizobium TaxID=2631580 RepID=UPI0031F81BE4|nr:hypothetical protein [Bradyrhizobium sp. 180]MCK1667771.1 hypothetical protein [Bradyrhizobium sp. 153]